MPDTHKKTILRFAVVFAVITLLFILVLCQIINLQYVDNKRWLEIAGGQVYTNCPIAAQRGNIYDAEGRLLASSIPQYTIHMDTRVEALQKDHGKLFYEYLDSICIGLSGIIGDKKPEAYRQQILTAYKGRTSRQRDIRLYSGRISYTQKKAIQQLPLIKRGYYKSGIYFNDQHRRVKPFSSLGSRTIGNIYGEGGHGAAGLEKRFDDMLSGCDGLSTRQRVAGHWQNVPVREAESGADIYTTLDANLMDICENELRSRLTHVNADWGCVLLMEVQTGAIKAICNLDRGMDGQYHEIANHAVMRVEPGSTFKTISLLAALDDGKVDLDDTLRVWENGWMYYNAKHYDSHPRDTVYTIRQALAVSSNIAFARMVVKCYNGSAKKFVRKLKEMGLKDSIDFTIPGADQARINAPNDTVTISRMAYGYSVEMSPLQSLTFYNGIANDGKMISPLFVSKVQQNGKTIATYHAKTIRNSMCSEKALRAIRLCLHDVVWDDHLGTASVNPWKIKKAQSDMVHIAGKTGTAQLLTPQGYDRRKHRISFVGYFPEENPQYTCMCVMQHPHNYGAYDAGMDCGIVVRHIAEKTMISAGEYIIQGDSLVFERKK